MIAVFCLLVVLGLGRCQDNDLPSGPEIESSINRTIEEVERKVREDPSLPRLTRQEIVDILYNITTNELNLYQDKEKMEKARKMYQRALMVVLPYNAQDSSVDLNDLYTKPPMTQIIPDDSKSGNYKYLSRGQKERNEIVVDLKEPNGKNQQTVPSTIENLVSTRGSHASPTRSTQSTTLRNRYKNHRETYSDVQTKAPLKETLKLDSSPVKFTFDLDDLRKNAFTTERTTAARHPVYKNTSNGKSKGDSNLEVIYSTSTTIEPTKKTAPKEIMIDLEESKSSTSTSKPESVLSANQWRYNAPPSTALKSPTPFKVSEHKDKASLSPTTIKVRPEDGVVVRATKQPDAYIKSSNVPMVAEQLLKNEQPSTLYVTPMSTETSVKSKYSSTYSLNSGGFRTVTTTTPQPMREEVMSLLASIGLSPDNSSNVEDVYKKNKDNLEIKSQIQNLNNVIYTTVSGLTSVGSDSPSMANQNTFEGPGSEINKGVANLTPDVQLLFQRFGLQTSNPDRTTTSTTQRTTVNLNSYTNFKPLPTSGVKDQGMKEFLAKFGLGLGDRRQKAMKPSSKRPSLIESVPDNMRNILENIGLISRRRKVPNIVQEEERDMESTETTNFHVFKPHEVDLKDENQRTKINELLDTVRMVQEGKGDIREVKKAATDLLRATKTLKDGPDPLSLEEIIRIYNEDVKNEVKRQQEETTTVSAEGQGQDTTTAASMTESAETTSATTTTMTDSAKAATGLTESSTASSGSSDSATTATVASTTSTNLLALEESFGGTTREPDPVLPTRRKSGLYFLVDWNTFLEVGEEDQGKVNLRFQPKAGDRTRFLPVTVP